MNGDAWFGDTAPVAGARPRPYAQAPTITAEALLHKIAVVAVRLDMNDGEKLAAIRDLLRKA